jgi:hypothetical protein
MHLKNIREGESEFALLFENINEDGRDILEMFFLTRQKKLPNLERA